MGILVALIISFLMIIAAKRNGFFELPLKYPPYPLPLKFAVGAFATYFATTLFILPMLYLIIGYFIGGSFDLSILKALPKQSLYWVQFLSFVVFFIVFVVYLWLIPRDVSRNLLWREKQSLKSFRLGVLSWAVAYPLVVLLGLVIGLFSFWIFGKNGVEQAAVKELKQIKDAPLLFLSLALAIVVLVPFMEEVLFRGFLQTYLRRHLSRKQAIFIASIIFALFHFSTSQGVGNIELIASLTLLSFFLGFLYEREQNLFAPFGLHMTFNGVSVVGIFFQG